MTRPEYCAVIGAHLHSCRNWLPVVYTRSAIVAATGRRDDGLVYMTIALRWPEPVTSILFDQQSTPKKVDKNTIKFNRPWHSETDTRTKTSGRAFNSD